jgi:mRNA-degrading endonuclease RelE of RelBE toxin-antitoxin system
MAKRIVWTQQARADLRQIDRPIALQILKTLARYAHTGEGNVKRLRAIESPVLRLRAQDYRIFFRDKGDFLEIARVLHRKEAYR